MSNLPPPGVEARDAPSGPGSPSAADSKVAARAYLIAFTAGAALILALLAYDLVDEQRSTRLSWKLRLSETAAAAAGRVSDWFAERRSDATVLAASPAVQRMLSVAAEPGGAARLRSERQLRRYLDEAARAYGYQYAYVLAPDGDALATSGGAPDLDPEARRLTFATLGQRDVDDFVVEGSPHVLLAFAAAVREPDVEEPLDPDRPLRGAVVLITDPRRRLFPMVAREAIPTRTGESLLVHHRLGEIVAISPLRHLPGGEAEGATRLLSSAMRRLLQLEEFGRVADYRGVEVLASAQKMTQPGWTVISKIDADEAFRDLRSQAWLEGAGAILLIVGFGGLLRSQWQRRRAEILSSRLAHEHALHESEERLRLAVDSANIALWDWDLATDRVYYSARWKRQLGHQLHEIGDRISEWTERLHPDDRRRVVTELEAYLARPESRYQSEFRLRHKDGSYRWLFMSGSVFVDAAGRARRMVGAHIDVTDRKETEVTLKEAQERLRTVVDNAPVALFALDRQGRFTIFEGSAMNGTPLDFRDAIGRAASEVVRGLDATDDSGRAIPAEVLLGRALLGDAGRGVISAAGRFYETRFEHLRDPEGRVAGVIGVATDVTERNRAEEALRRFNAELERRVAERTAELAAANRELEAFCHSVSHDLRSPLRGIDGFSQALLEDYAPTLDEEGRRYLTRIRAAALRMSDLIGDLLALSRVVRAEMRRQTVDLSQMAQDVVANLHRTRPGRDVDATIAPDMKVEGDATLLRLVVENLLDNAWKYTGKVERARVEFGCTEANGERVFFVRDNGAGFDMAYADKLFGAFQRLHGMEEFEGTGVGLATVQRIVRRHGGRIWADAAVGRGATFSFTLASAPREVGQSAA